MRSARKTKRKSLDNGKRLRSTTRMKKITFKEIVASVRKTGGRPSTAFVPKKQKAKQDRNSWKRDLE